VRNKAGDLVGGKLNRVFVVHAPVNPFFVIDVCEQMQDGSLNVLGRRVVLDSVGIGSAKLLVRNMKNERVIRPQPLDKKWSETIERTWGNVRDRLKAGENAPELLDQLFWFVSAQFIRTHSFMSRVGRQISWEERKKSQVTLDGREGIVMNVADTTSVMDRVQASWPTARDALETDYLWTVYHNHSERLFLTSDDPCQLDDRTQKVVMPLALDLAITGRLVRDSEAPYVRHSDASAEVVRKINQGVVTMRIHNGCCAFTGRRCRDGCVGCTA